MKPDYRAARRHLMKADPKLNLVIKRIGPCELHSVAPKDPAQRRRYNQPARGEWVDLEPLEEPILCGYDEMRFTIPVWLWQAWRADAVTSQYGEADMGAIV